MKETPLFPIVVALLVLCMVSPPSVLASTISFNPSSIVVYADGNGSVTVMIDEIPEGLSGYYITAEVSNPDAAEITKISFPGWTLMSNVTDVPSAQVRFGGADIEDHVVAGATNVVLATIGIRAKNPGSAALSLHSININDDSGMLIEPAVNTASINVTGSSGEGSSSGSWSAGGGSGGSSGGGTSGGSPGDSAGTSFSGDTNEGTIHAGIASTNERSGESSPGSDSPDGSAAEDTSVAPPNFVPSPLGPLPIPSLWIALIGIMVGAAAIVLYLAFTRRI